MSKLKISLYLAALFLAGAATGSILTVQIGKQMMMHAMQPGAMADHWLGDLETRLSLTPAQAEKIAPIIQENMKGFGPAMRDQMSLALSNCNAQIELELTSEQKLKFAQIEREQQQFIQSRFNGGPPPKFP